MLLRFTNDFLSTISQGVSLLADIQLSLAKSEPYLGSSRELDRAYAQSVVIAGLIDYLSNTDNSNPREDEALLMCLRSAISKNACRRPRNGVKDWANYHKLPDGQNPIIKPTPEPTPEPQPPVVPEPPVINNPIGETPSVLNTTDTTTTTEIDPIIDPSIPFNID
jgi:hypothetical protein